MLWILWTKRKIPEIRANQDVRSTGDIKGHKGPLLAVNEGIHAQEFVYVNGLRGYTGEMRDLEVVRLWQQMRQCHKINDLIHRFHKERCGVLSFEQCLKAMKTARAISIRVYDGVWDASECCIDGGRQILVVEATSFDGVGIMSICIVVDRT